MVLQLKNIPYKLLILGILLLVFSCKTKKRTEDSSIANSQNKFTKWVNPFIGTAPLTDPDKIGYTPPEGWRVWAGLTFPGSSLPNAMVQLSPITEYGSGAGYEYEDEEILAFAHTNKGHWNLVNIPVLPVSGEASNPFKSTFSHDTEKASPGFYEVFLEDFKVKVRLTSTLRAGIHEYNYEDKKNRKILFDLGKANNRVSDWEITTHGNNEIRGYQRVGRDRIHFVAKLNTVIEDFEVTEQGERDGYAMVYLQDGSEEVLMKIGLSYVSTENAAENLEQEIGTASFEEIRNRANETWETLLSSVEVSGGNEKQNEMFYTSFYRSFLWPALRSDVNGEFTDVNGDVVSADFNYYTDPSFWDTYRNKLVLLTIVSPDVTRDVIKSLIEKGEKTGFIPNFFHGDHAAPFISGAYKRGLRGYDVEKAYELLLNNAYKEEGPRAHILEYIDKGYISDPNVKNPEVETKGNAGVSKTLEYAYDDYSLALLAKELGDTQHYEDLMKRSGNYKNVFDSSTNFMRGRLENGDWISPFDSEYPYYEYMFREANAWQVSFFVPHDMTGLIKLYGGEENFEKKLDSLFTVPWNPNHIARNVSSFIGQYSHGNQPGHEAPFSYYFINKPEKSQEIIDNILENYYGIGEEGLALSGMDDAGEMSSWYVMAATGLYSFSPADDEYIVTVPIFEEVKWNIPGSKQLVITNPNSGRKLREIQVDGQPIDGYFVPHDLFINGGKIELVTDKN
ncbi:GH92 family glycosyl hydrolase [Salinimicrobium sp. GXAS 041]|uniref:GH92 family glycosyl hydrolase n=1 Tax=Salinimicrobium sp. GXAS 041 TaxID=3400806 RepID=UPI003C71E696